MPLSIWQDWGICENRCQFDEDDVQESIVPELRMMPLDYAVIVKIYIAYW